MEGRSHDEKDRNNQNSEHDSAGLKANVFVDSVEIKREPDIKWEQEDDVDTIEYTPTLDNLGEDFTVKIEKVESDNEDDDDETGNMTTDRQVAGCSYNYGERTAQMSKMHTRPDKENVERPSTSKNINKRQSTSLPKPKQHKCTECDYVTAKPSILDMHMRKHSGEKPFPCKICSKRFSQNTNLQRHMKVHATKDSVHCSQCFKIFATKEEKLNHESVCKRRLYECFLCHALSCNITNLKIHMRMHSGVRPFRCEQCFKKFTQKGHSERHMKICSLSPKFRCSVCARSFSKESEKDEHEMKCKRRRYECHLCQKYSTYTKHSLQHHMRMRHTGERPFKCNSCGKCHAMLSGLNQHKKASHKH